GSCCDQYQDKDNQGRRRGPGDLDRLAAVNLRRFGGGGIWLTAEANHRIEKYSFDNEEDQACYSKDQEGQFANRLGRRRNRVEDRQVLGISCQEHKRCDRHRTLPTADRRSRKVSSGADWLPLDSRSLSRPVC